MAPSPTIRRLLKETKELSEASSNPNPAFYAAPVSDSDLHEWHFTLLGPPAPSPYAGGFYHGRISLPPAYPMKPPNFRFLTASGRFEVNREICLSISGFHEETWQPAWGIRTALTALRSFMAEPGTAGQVGGMESTDEVRMVLAKASRSWRCATCGQTNEERMKRWWNTCAERGIKVEEEHMAIEALPDGMSVEARSPQGPVQKTQDTNSPDIASSTGASKNADDAIRTAESPPEVAATNSSTPSKRSTNTNKDLNHQGSVKTASYIHPDEKQKAQPNQEQLIETSREVTTTSTTSNIQAQPPSRTSLRQIPMIRTESQQATLTIDRAITVVFLALCVMVLKKIFYPAGSTGFAYDELDMMRE